MMASPISPNMDRLRKLARDNKDVRWDWLS